MKKDKVIIFGLGSDYKLYQKSLHERFEVIGYSDNYGSCKEEPIASKYIMPSQIAKTDFDKVIICTRIYYEAAKYQLLYQYHIPENKIDYMQKCGDEESEMAKAESVIFASVDQYRKMNTNPLFEVENCNLWLICSDYDAPAGKVDYHYFPQDLWMAQKIYQNHPDKHYDIGSRLDGFISHLLVFMKEVNYIDIRPLPYPIGGLNFVQADATNLETIEDNSLESLSSLHAVEHFGLGRYGDPIDPDACFKAMRAFVRVLRPGGHLYFSVPIGPKNKLAFNAHRIFHPQTIIDNMRELDLINFAVIKKNPLKPISEEVALDKISEIAKEIPDFSCGLFEFIKPKKEKE